MDRNQVELPESHPMNGGDGAYSYAKNSCLQRLGRSELDEMINEAIAEKLDVKNVSTFRIADLGCSVGPNTFLSMQNIIQALQKKYNTQNTPEFEVYFNDHVANDFNTLFTSLPPARPYFAVGVPGSFYGRLFPESSMHFVHSAYAVQWMSKVPEEVMDKNSYAWNKKVFHPNAEEGARKAYEAQFFKDMEVFFECRAKEIVVGGMMVLVLPIIANGTPLYQNSFFVIFDLIESSLRDMVEEGLIDEEKMDSFNLPVYAPTSEEMRKLVEENGCFSIERMVELGGPKNVAIDSKVLAMQARSGIEGTISKHFGREILDGLFDRFECKMREFIHVFSGNSTKAQLLLILKRK